MFKFKFKLSDIFILTGAHRVRLLLLGERGGLRAGPGVQQRGVRVRVREQGGEAGLPGPGPGLERGVLQLSLPRSNTLLRRHAVQAGQTHIDGIINACK